MRTRDFQVKFTPCVLAAIISVLCAADAKASPITYTESATVSGLLNGNSFSGDVLTLTGTGDTTNITNPSTGGFLNTVTLRFSVAGVGGGTFLDAIHVFDDQSAAGAGFLDPARIPPQIHSYKAPTLHLLAMIFRLP
jgi:hypothetical protein